MSMRSKMIQKLEKRRSLFLIVFGKWPLVTSLDIYRKVYNDANSKAEGLIKKLKRNKFGFMFLIFHYWSMIRELTQAIFMVLNFEMLCHDMAGFNNLPLCCISPDFKTLKNETTTLMNLDIPLSIAFKDLKK